MSQIRFRSIGTPDESVGQSFKGQQKIVVPNQSLSLEEILDRFTRGEPLPIGKDFNYDEEGDDDLEKVAAGDLVDREEYVEKLKETKRRYDVQEKKRASAEHARLEKLAVEKIEADKKAAAEEAAKKAAK